MARQQRRGPITPTDWWNNLEWVPERTTAEPFVFTTTTANTRGDRLTYSTLLETYRKLFTNQPLLEKLPNGDYYED